MVAWQEPASIFPRMNMCRPIADSSAQPIPPNSGSGHEPDAIPTSPWGSKVIDAKTRLLLESPALPALLRLAWPNILVMMAQSSTGLIEMWFVARLGTDALTGMALVLPLLVLMQSMS
jgi:hypothetical protein